MKKITVSIQVDEDLINLIRSEANKEGLSVSAFLRRLIIKNLKKED